MSRKKSRSTAILLRLPPDQPAVSGQAVVLPGHKKGAFSRFCIDCLRPCACSAYAKGVARTTETAGIKRLTLRTNARPEHSGVARIFFSALYTHIIRKGSRPIPRGTRTCVASPIARCTFRICCPACFQHALSPLPAPRSLLPAASGQFWTRRVSWRAFSSFRSRYGELDRSPNRANRPKTGRAFFALHSAGCSWRHRRAGKLVHRLSKFGQPCPDLASLVQFWPDLARFGQPCP